MRVAGIDIGSRTIKLVVREDGHVVRQIVRDTTWDPLRVCSDLLVDLSGVPIVATGYGRHLFKERWGAAVITEIKAVAKGAHVLRPTCRVVVDVGGQDTKAVAVDPAGRIRKFSMNDRCAAGTGRFLEVMALALAYSPEEFVQAALDASRAERLNSMCTVFAESEVVSHVARGADRTAIALGIHQAIATRTVALAKGVPLEDDVVFTGGGARNACLVGLVERGIGRRVHVPASPQTVAALGCALEAEALVLGATSPAAMREASGAPAARPGGRQRA